jgi:hypothetical protein
MSQRMTHKRRQNRRGKRRHAKPVVTIRFVGQSIYVTPPCNQLAAFCTERLVPNPTKPRLLEPMFRPNREFFLAEGDAEPAEHTLGVWLPAGLLEPVCLVLDRAGYDVQVQNNPVDLPKIAKTSHRRGAAQDPAVLEFVRTNARGLVTIGEKVDAAGLCSQIAKAWPLLKIAVVGSRKKTVAHAAHALQDVLGDHAVTHITEYRPERIARVTVSTFSGQSKANLNERRLILILDPVELFGCRSRVVLDFSPTARLIGFLPRDLRMTRRETDLVHSYFGFKHLEVPAHGSIARDIVVVRSTVRGGPRIDVGDDMLELKRRGIWRNQMRNRRIARLVQLIQQPQTKELRRRFQGVVSAVKGRQIRTIAVLVENLEHAQILHTLIPESSVASAFDRGVAETDEDQAVAVQIITQTALPQLRLENIDVIVRADGCPGFGFPYVAAHIAISAHSPYPLLVVDFADQTHPELRRWAKRRLEAYCDAGFTVAGELHSPVGRFLSQRPAQTGGL